MKSALKSPKNSYRKLLLKKRDELLATFRLDPEALTVSIRTPDAVEFASKTAEQDVTARSEEHTSELQSRLHLVCRLLLEKKKNNIIAQSGMQLFPKQQTMGHHYPVY